MENKTCGECVHYDKKLGVCDLTDDFSTVISNTPACVDFEIKPSIKNGDRIRMMSNEELAHRFAYPCPPGKVTLCTGSSNEQCKACWLEWLNSEVKQ